MPKVSGLRNPLPLFQHSPKNGTGTSKNGGATQHHGESDHHLWGSWDYGILGEWLFKSCQMVHLFWWVSAARAGRTGNFNFWDRLSEFQSPRHQDWQILRQRDIENGSIWMCKVSDTGHPVLQTHRQKNNIIKDIWIFGHTDRQTFSLKTPEPIAVK